MEKLYHSKIILFYFAIYVIGFSIPLFFAKAETTEQIALSAVQLNQLILDNKDLIEEEAGADINIVNSRVSLSGSGLITYQADSISTDAYGGIKANKVLATGTATASNCTIQFSKRSLSPITLNLIPFENIMNTAMQSYLVDEGICVDSVKVTPVQIIYTYHPVVYGDTTANNGQTSTTEGKKAPTPKSTGGIVPACGKPGLPACDFNMLLELINNVINYLLFVIATPLVALILVYVGWLYLSSGGNSENIGKAKRIFGNVILGYVIGLAAWLIIKTILISVGFTGPMFLK